jgi:hypothetical protein
MDCVLFEKTPCAEIITDIIINGISVRSMFLIERICNKVQLIPPRRNRKTTCAF